MPLGVPRGMAISTRFLATLGMTVLATCTPVEPIDLGVRGRPAGREDDPAARGALPAIEDQLHLDAPAGDEGDAAGGRSVVERPAPRRRRADVVVAGRQRQLEPATRIDLRRTTTDS